jgi:hypothetical protein
MRVSQRYRQTTVLGEMIMNRELGRVVVAYFKALFRLSPRGAKDEQAECAEPIGTSKHAEHR